MAFATPGCLLHHLILLCSFAACAAYVQAQASPGKAAAHGPNIIFIMADDLGYGDLGSYGSKHIETPHIDRLAEEGMRFTQCYSGSPLCAPARSVLMTGKHAGRTPIRHNAPFFGGVLEQFEGGRSGNHRISLDRDTITVAQVLRSAGYATGIAGKWGLAEPGTDGIPTRKGFDEWLGYLNQNHADYYYTDRLDENEGHRAITENSGGRTAVYSNDLFSDFAIDFVRRHRGRPFFLYLPFTIPHFRMEVPDLGVYAHRKWPEDARIYAAMVTRLDSYVGRLLSELDRLGLTENTLVMFTSDNGPVAEERSRLLGSSGGLRGYKATLYEGGIRIPMIARWPGRIAAGSVNDSVWSFVDLFPTFVEVARAPKPRNLDGMSVLPLLQGEEIWPDDRLVYWELPTLGGLHQAARRGPWKLIRHGAGSTPELYDIVEDSQETTNVAASHPEIVAALEQAMEAAHTPSPHWPVQ